jgi:predicted phosphodiesterase
MISRESIAPLRLGQRMGLLADLHGNRAALDAILQDGSKNGIRDWVCLGDFVDPLPDSAWMFRELKRLGIPIVRGNHEDYMVWARWLADGQQGARPKSETSITNSVRYHSVFRAARDFSQLELQELEGLPLTISQGEVLYCHASPDWNMRGYVFDFEEDIRKSVEGVSETVIVCGHWHTPWSDAAHPRVPGKRLFSIGSGGIAFSDSAGRAQYGVIEAGRAEGELPSVQQCEVRYDHQVTLKRYETSGYLAEGGPMAWALYLEIATGQRVLRPLRNHCVEVLGLHDVDEEEWWIACRAWIERMGLSALLPRQAISGG